MTMSTTIGQMCTRGLKAVTLTVITIAINLPPLRAATPSIMLLRIACMPNGPTYPKHNFTHKTKLHLEEVQRASTEHQSPRRLFSLKKRDKRSASEQRQKLHLQSQLSNRGSLQFKKPSVQSNNNRITNNKQAALKCKE